MYGSRHIGAIKSLATAVMVFATAVSPVAIGLGIDFGVHIETLAWCSAIYMVGASVLAYTACRMPAKT